MQAAWARAALWQKAAVYRQVIDATLAGVRVDFEEMGIEEDVITILQQVGGLVPL